MVPLNFPEEEMQELRLQEGWGLERQRGAKALRRDVVCAQTRRAGWGMPQSREPGL